MGLFEAADGVDHLGAMPKHGIRVALRVMVLAVGQRRLGHQRPEPGVVGGLGQVLQLLVGDGELLAELAQARRHLGQASLHEGPGHARQCTRPLFPDPQPIPVGQGGVNAGTMRP